MKAAVNVKKAISASMLGFDRATALPPVKSALRLCADGTDAFFQAVDSFLGAHETRLDRILVGYQVAGLLLFVVLSTLYTLAMCFVPAEKKRS
jgi:hypothetical protein